MRAHSTVRCRSPTKTPSAEKKRQDTGSETVESQTACSVAGSESARGRRRITDTNYVDLSDQVSLQRIHTEAILGQRKAAKRWYGPQSCLQIFAPVICAWWTEMVRLLRASDSPAT